MSPKCAKNFLKSNLKKALKAEKKPIFLVFSSKKQKILIKQHISRSFAFVFFDLKKHLKALKSYFLKLHLKS